MTNEPPNDSFSIALRRAQAEFLEMPGLQLTVAQAARLWHFDSALCTAVLTTLVEQRFLVETKHRSFARA
jgi:Fic family protein